MTFEEVVDQALAMLQRRGRVTYRLLKRQFSLDDEALEDLKCELIEGQRLAADEHGTVLVWTGHDAPMPTPASTPIDPPPVLHAAPTPAAPPPPAPPPPDAERRQLTVMFCDLVNSTQLSSQLDPEEYRDVVRAYQTACTEVIRRYDGHSAQLLGDGLLVYFGYPQAHEDDAQRAVHTGLGILEAVGALQTRLEQDKSIGLAVRLGIHTGLVVVGEMGPQGRQEQLALGEVPNVCSRIQGLAAPNTILISTDTYRLIQGYFECQALGKQTLRGVAQPLQVYRVLQASRARGRLDVAQIRGLTPLVGRESEVALLQERWAQVKDGQGHVVLLTGEAGIGKSRLVQMLKDHVAQESHVRWECRSTEYYQNSALYPVIDLFQRIWQFEAHETPDEKVGKLEHALSQYRLPVVESVPLLAPLLSLALPEHRYPPLHLSPQRQRQKTLEIIVAIFLELAEHQPVLFILEDLHWTDPSSLELIGLLIDQTPTASICVLLTCRPHFQPAWHHRSYLTEITVNRLSHAQVAQIVIGMTEGKALPTEVLQQILEKTDGVPLFVEELTKAILESGYLKETDGHYVLTGTFSSLAIPTTLQDSLMARLDRLVTAKAVAQYAAVLGRQFSYDLLQAVSQVDEAMLQHELGRLVEAEIVYQRGVPSQATYTFKHALIQETAYASLLKSTRQSYHQRIAHVLEYQFRETAEVQPELVAHHFTEARRIEPAVAYWHKAAQRAVERSAHVEALAHLQQGLELLKTLPETAEPTQCEVNMYLALGVSLNATKGYGAPEVGQTYTYARQLCHHLEDPSQLFPVLEGLYGYYLVRAEHQTAYTLGAQLLTLAQQVHDGGMLMVAHRSMGQTLSYLGAPATAHPHLTQGIALYDAQPHRASVLLYGEDTGVVCRCHDALLLWLLGYPEQGLAQLDDALTLAQQRAHPLSLAYALTFAATCHQYRREVSAAQECAEALISLAAEQGFPYWMAIGALRYGWALAQQGQAQEGIVQMQQGLTAWRAIGAGIGRPYWLALLAEVYGTMEQPEAGLRALTEALTLAETTGERLNEPELYRLKGELLLQQPSDNQPEAETCFHHAIHIAQSQQAKSWELRAATSLARLWQQQDKRVEARDLLAPLYGWFTEGFDTADLQEAKALLDELKA